MTQYKPEDYIKYRFEKGDYNDFFDFDYDTVARLYGPARELVHRIGELLTSG